DTVYTPLWQEVRGAPRKGKLTREVRRLQVRRSAGVAGPDLSGEVEMLVGAADGFVGTTGGDGVEDRLVLARGLEEVADGFVAIGAVEPALVAQRADEVDEALVAEPTEYAEVKRSVILLEGEPVAGDHGGFGVSDQTPQFGVVGDEPTFGDLADRGHLDHAAQLHDLLDVALGHGGDPEAAVAGHQDEAFLGKVQ